MARISSGGLSTILEGRSDARDPGNYGDHVTPKAPYETT